MAVNYFTPKAIGWETTLACNMFCKHCGSIAGYERDKELTTDQALELCRQLDAFPEGHVTLTGGETFVRKDWPVIVEELVKRRGAVGIISNAWLIDRDQAKLLKELQGSKGRINLGISLDGDRERHDFIRKPGSYDRVISGLKNLHEEGIYAGIITTINTDNIHYLDHVRDVVFETNSYGWQLQITSEYGRAAENTELILNRDLYRRVVEAVARYRKELKGSGVTVCTADCLGFHGPHEKDLRNRPWYGCHAGLRCLGIQSNGNVKGCLSLLEDVFIEGNILETPLADIWKKPGAFTYNREFTPDQLTGPCAQCSVGYYCRAGCHSTGYSILGTCNEAPYCVHAEDQGLFDENAKQTKDGRPASHVVQIETQSGV